MKTQRHKHPAIRWLMTLGIIGLLHTAPRESLIAGLATFAIIIAVTVEILDIVNEYRIRRAAQKEWDSR